MGGGILPFAVHNNKIYFLFSREYNKGKSEGGSWSDFGGSKEKGETYKDTALREGWEESNNILGNKEKIKKLIEKNTIRTLTFNGYRTYIVAIYYNKKLPEIFRNNFLEVKKNKPHLINKNGFYEKDKLEWVEYEDIKNKMHMFRPWYRGMIKELLKMY